MADVVRRAKLTLPAPLAWSTTGALFDGYAIFDLVLPHNWWSPELPDAVYYRGAPTEVAPHRIVVPVRSGVFPDQPVLPLSNQYESDGSWYVLHYHDPEMALVAGPTTLFQVMTDVHEINLPGLVIPNNVGWPSNPFTYTILWIDQRDGKDSNTPTGMGEQGYYGTPWKTVHNLEWFNINEQNRILLRKHQMAPWVDVTYQYPEFTMVPG
jgi:hypothetical protein